MNNPDIISQTADFVKAKLSGEGSGHDWFHIERVWKTALHIGERENVDMFVVELAALLHDIADWKFSDGDDTAGPREARVWMQQLNVDENTIAHVCEIIKDLSFKGAGVRTAMKTREGMVVQGMPTGLMRWVQLESPGRLRMAAIRNARSITHPLLQHSINPSSNTRTAPDRRSIIFTKNFCT